MLGFVWLRILQHRPLSWASLFSPARSTAIWVLIWKGLSYVASRAFGEKVLYSLAERASTLPEATGFLKGTVHQWSDRRDKANHLVDVLAAWHAKKMYYHCELVVKQFLTPDPGASYSSCGMGCNFCRAFPDAVFSDGLRRLSSLEFEAALGRFDEAKRSVKECVKHVLNRHDGEVRFLRPGPPGD